MSTDDQIAQLADWIARANGRCVALTGAGASTESGLPDFRGPDGLWRQLDWQRVAHIQTAYGNPELLWEFYGERLAGLEGVQPNATHRVLSAMERAGLLDGVLTQNVDGLHTAAGSREVVELHGSLRVAHCLDGHCDTTVPIEDAQAQLAEGKAYPTCVRCGSPLKPSIVLFGEELPWGATRRGYELTVGPPACRVLLCLGSTLEVYPVARIPREARLNGAKVAVINLGPTGYDTPSSHDLRIEAKLGPTMELLAERLGLSV